MDPAVALLNNALKHVAGDYVARAYVLRVCIVSESSFDDDDDDDNVVCTFCRTRTADVCVFVRGFCVMLFVFVP